jgi:hypothetical protein
MLIVCKKTTLLWGNLEITKKNSPSRRFLVTLTQEKKERGKALSSEEAPE